MTDQQAIREVIARWQQASQAGDLETLRSLMSEDVVFLLPGRPPMLKDEFMYLQAAPRPAGRLEFQHEIMDLTLHGDWAHFWSKLAVTFVPEDHAPSVRRSGHTLTVFRKLPDGRWVLARDANLLTVDQGV